MPDATKRATLDAFDQVFGLKLSEWQPVKQAQAPAEVVALAEERQKARANKDWAAADAARDKLAALGYEVVDTADGFELKQS